MISSSVSYFGILQWHVTRNTGEGKVVSFVRL